MAPKKKDKTPSEQTEQQKPDSPTEDKKNAAAEKPVKAKKNKRAKAKKRRFPFLLVFILLLLIAASALMYFNFFSARDIVIETIVSTVNKLDPDYVRYANRLTELDGRELELDEREARLLKDEQTLATKKTQLEKLEQELSVTEAASKPVYSGTLSEEKLAELKNLGKIYSLMDAATAAEIMVQLYDVLDMTAIIYYMNKSAAAAVLEAMDPTLAAEITMKMLRD